MPKVFTVHREGDGCWIVGAGYWDDVSGGGRCFLFAAKQMSTRTLKRTQDEKAWWAREAGLSQRQLLNALQRFNTKVPAPFKMGSRHGPVPHSSAWWALSRRRSADVKRSRSKEVEEWRSRSPCTYTVLMLFMASNVPLASDWMLLSYRESRLKLCRSRKASLRMHEISLAFSSSSCSEPSPLNTPEGKSFILLPYSTLMGWCHDGTMATLTMGGADMEKNTNRTHDEC